MTSSVSLVRHDCIVDGIGDERRESTDGDDAELEEKRDCWSEDEGFTQLRERGGLR